MSDPIASSPASVPNRGKTLVINYDHQIASSPAPVPDRGRAYKYYDLVMAAFVTVMLCSNLISVHKRVSLKEALGVDIVFGAGVLFFPFSYIFGDILTEVYGYARSRRVVWAGFAALVYATFVSVVVLWLPPDATWTKQATMEAIFGNTPRIVLGSLLGFLAGEFANSYTLAKMKVWTEGRWLWSRMVASTIVGELVDSAIFLNVAFRGAEGWPADRIWKVLFFNYVFKVANEVLMTPLTYVIVNFLKKAENEDYYDRDTDFTPFSLKT